MTAHRGRTPRMRMVDVRSRQLRVEVWPGDARRPPLLICNGIGASLDMVRPFVAALDPELEVVLFDVPGVGGSPTPLMPYTFMQMACTADRLMEVLGYDTFNVLGYSWGGALAQQIAVQSPRRVQRLILLSTGTGSIMVPGRPSVLRKMVTPRRFRDPDYGASLAGMIYGGSARRHASEVQHVVREAINSDTQRGYFYQLLAGLGWTSLPFLWAIKQQTLVLSGDDDPIVPTANGRIMAKMIPNARLHIFSGGHAEPVLAPEEVAEQVSTFLAAPMVETAADDGADRTTAPPEATK